MVDIRYFIIIQILAVAILLITVSIFMHQYYKYNRLKKLYRTNYAKLSTVKSIGRLLPLMPGYKSRRYRDTERLIIDSGLEISIEGFYLAKTLFFIAAFVFFTSIQTTNTFLLYNSIIDDLNLEKTPMDEVIIPDASDIRLEREIFNYLDSNLPGDKITLRELTNVKNSQMYIEYLETRIRNKWSGLKEDAGVIAKRMHRKLIKVRTLESNYIVYLTALLSAVFMYFLPNIFCRIKLKLIEDKRDWEILNYIYVFSIFGRMPPFNIKNVLSNILIISEIYKPIITEALNGVKSGEGEVSLDKLLQRVESEELYELLEAVRLSMNTGLLNIVDSIDEMAANQLKWQEIKSLKRRKTKQVIAMVPVVLVMFVAVLYFSYSMSMLSNPMNFINK